MWIDRCEFQRKALIMATIYAVLFARRNLPQGIPSRIRWIIFGEVPPARQDGRVEFLHCCGRIWEVHLSKNRYQAWQLPLKGSAPSFYIQGDSRSDLGKAMREASFQDRLRSCGVGLSTAVVDRNRRDISRGWPWVLVASRMKQLANDLWVANSLAPLLR